MLKEYRYEDNYNPLTIKHLNTELPHGISLISSDLSQLNIILFALTAFFLILNGYIYIYITRNNEYNLNGGSLALGSLTLNRIR